MTTPASQSDADLRPTASDTTNTATNDSTRGASNPVESLSWPVHTDRLTLRPATHGDLAATWDFRRLDDVSRWLTRAPATLEEYRASFADASSLAKTLVVELDDQVIGDLMLQVEDGWAQSRGRRPGARCPRRAGLGPAPRPCRTRLRH
jgi:GNAT acetyltransferase-like protein